MALYSFSVDIISRGKGQSVTSTAAYNNGARLKDTYTGTWYDNSSKKDILFCGILLPEEAPMQLYDLQTFVDALNHAEKRCNSQMAQLFKLALPLELTPEEQLTLLKEFCCQNFISKKQGVSYAIHHGKLIPAKQEKLFPAIGERKDNPHAHLIVPFRRLDKDGFRKTKLESRSPNKVVDLIALRESWADLQNHAFEQKGLTVKVSHKSYREQGIDLTPSIHIGAGALANEVKGTPTKPGDAYLQILHKRLDSDRQAEIQKLMQQREQKREAERGPSVFSQETRTISRSQEDKPMDIPRQDRSPMREY